MPVKAMHVQTMPRAKQVLGQKDTDVFVLQGTKAITVNQVPDYCTSDTIFNNLVIITGTSGKY